MPETVKVTLPSDREIQVARSFDAPAQRVFDFHTKPELVQRWLLGPPGWTMPICEIDLKVGGKYRYVWRSNDLSNEFGVAGDFQEITVPTRLVYTGKMDGVPGSSVSTLAFAESDGTTTLTTTMLFATRQERDHAAESGMTDGMAMSYDRLDDFISERS